MKPTLIEKAKLRVIKKGIAIIPKTMPISFGANIRKMPRVVADYFAACILMPREWVKEKWVEVKDLGRMAEIFGVPQTMMGVRLRQLGLI